jgi:hypothetical protein
VTADAVGLDRGRHGRLPRLGLERLAQTRSSAWSPPSPLGQFLQHLAGEDLSYRK